MTNIVKNKNGIEFDIDAIATDLNGKLDRDCLNRSDVASNVMASMCIPDYTKKQIFDWDTDFVVPANGVVMISANIASEYRIDLIIDGVSSSASGIGNNGNQGGDFELQRFVAKGSIIKATGGNSRQYALFFPLKGAN